jgi:hypothetical protein
MYVFDVVCRTVAVILGANMLLGICDFVEICRLYIVTLMCFSVMDGGFVYD